MIRYKTSTRYMAEKKCTQCGIVKPRSAYYARLGTLENQGTLHSACKACEFAARKEYRRKHPKQAAFHTWKAKLKRIYGITHLDYARMFEDQGGQCAVCDRESPDGRRLHVDHCHTSGRVRGLLCHDCNRGLGMFKDDAARLRRAADYLT